MNRNQFLEAMLLQHLNVHYSFPHFSFAHYQCLFFQSSVKALESADCHQLATEATELCNTTGPWQM